MRDISIFQVEKVRKAAARASEKAVAQATAYLWKTARNSVKKTKGREKKYELKMFLHTKKHAINAAGGSYINTTDDGVIPAKQYWASPNRQNEKIVISDSKYDVRNPKTQGRYLRKTPSAAGKPPHTHKTTQPGFIDYWLKKGIRFDPKAGVVYVNPIDKKSVAVSDSLPQVLELGGPALVGFKRLEGYFVYKRHYKNGSVTVHYRPAYSRRQKRYRMQARPFLVPAMKAAAEKLLKILERSIR